MIWLIGPAWAGTCASTTLGSLSATPAPAVFVLGERRGTPTDLARASRLVARLRGSGEPVTVALQAVELDKQSVLDRYADGGVEPSDLPGLLDWARVSGFPFAPYERLVTGALHDDKVLGIGLPLARRPDGVPLPLPPGYGAVLADAMSGHPMPALLEGELVQSVAWMDHRMARAAIENWTGKGYLVIVVDRLHVEGGKGVGWQAQRLVDAPVKSVLLGDAGACYDGDTHL